MESLIVILACFALVLGGLLSLHSWRQRDASFYQYQPLFPWNPLEPHSRGPAEEFLTALFYGSWCRFDLDDEDEA
jgi:hypothetical protein